MMFAAIAAGLPLPIINLIAVVIYYYINKSKSRFVRFHSLQALYSQIPITVMNAGLVFWSISRLFYSDCGFMDCPYWNEYIGFAIAVVIVNIIYFVLNIIAAIRARKGRMIYFVFFGKLAYHMAFSVNETNEPIAVNSPPKF